MRTTRRATPMVIAVAITLGVVGLTGCSTASSPAAVPTKAAKASTPAPPTKAAPTTKALEPGSVAVAGYAPAYVAGAARFAEKFALTAMSGCGELSVAGLQHLMTPELYKAALKNPKHRMVLTLNPPLVMSAGCVTSQTLSDARLSPGVSTEGVPSVRVDVTVTEGLMVGTTTSPKALKPITVSRRYTVDVLPYGKDWMAQTVITGNLTLITTGK